MSAISDTHAYGDHPRQQLTIHRPAPCDKNQHPGLFMIHGGYWSEKSSMRMWPERFAEAGWVVIEPTYRLNGDALWPAQRDDMLGALGWARDHAADISMDPDCVTVLGSSAGGHLAVQLGMFASDISAVVSLSGPLSPYRAWVDGEDTEGVWSLKRKKLRKAARKLAGCEPHRSDPDCWDQWVDLVCYQHASGGEPPMLLLYFQDDLVPLDHGSDLRSHEINEGAKDDAVTVVQVSGTGHGVGLLGVPGVEDMVKGFLEESLPQGS